MPTALPLATDFTGAAITEAQFKTAITNLHDYLSGQFNTTGAPRDALVALTALLSSTTTVSAIYTIVATDNGRLLDCTGGPWTLSFTAAATLGTGFSCAVRNSGSGTITLDPSGAELIDSMTTISLAPGESFLISCRGTEFKTIGRTVVSYPISIANGGTGNTTAAAALAALGGVSTDAGYNAVGSFSLCNFTAGGSPAVPSGGTIAGSYLSSVHLVMSIVSGNSAVVNGGALSGTWRNLGADIPLGATGRQTIMQRIA